MTNAKRGKMLLAIAIVACLAAAWSLLPLRTASGMCTARRMSRKAAKA